LNNSFNFLARGQASPGHFVQHEVRRHWVPLHTSQNFEFILAI
jgi:hypothetical protein